jgi:hypothetical protein
MRIPFPPSFDGAYVTVVAESIRFQFVRGRGDFSVRVASEFAPKEWEDLELVIAAMGRSAEPAESRPNYYLLRTLARVLPPHFEGLRVALSKERFESTLHNAVTIHNDRTDRYVAKLQEKGITPRFL